MVHRIVGICLVVVSAFSVIQTLREIALWERGSSYSDTLLTNEPIRFAGRVVTVSDDQPRDAKHSQQEFDGSIQLTIDSSLRLAPSHARVRRGLDDLGRYHGWFNAWIFRSVDAEDSTLWLVRRIQPNESEQPRFEITTVVSNGNVESHIFAPWELGTSFLRFRASQFVRGHEWTVMPLSMAAAFGLSPIVWLVFPLGTLFAGLVLLRHDKKKFRSLAA